MRLVRDRVHNGVQEKLCMKCNKFKPTSEFHKGGKYKFGVISTCKECSCNLREGRYLKNKDRLIALSKKYRESDKNRTKNYQLMNDYGITLDDYNKMLVNQEYKCLVCGTHHNSLKRGLMVDHDHSTGNIRGLLCDRCNKSLGLIRDNPLIADNMAKYLRENYK